MTEQQIVSEGRKVKLYLRGGAVIEMKVSRLVVDRADDGGRLTDISWVNDDNDKLEYLDADEVVAIVVHEPSGAFAAY